MTTGARVGAVAAALCVALGVGLFAERGVSAPPAEEALLADGLDWSPRVEADAEAAIAAARAADARTKDVPTIVVDYPLADSVFPPDMAAPELLWHDTSPADLWLVEVALQGGAARLSLLTGAEPPAGGEIDPRALGATNEVYRPTPYQASARAWRPSEALWRVVKQRSLEQPALVRIVGLKAGQPGRVLSRGSVSIRTSADPVGAPIFYRDVPLMPSKTEKNVIKPLAEAALPLIAWRLKDVSRRDSRVVLQDMPTCANCHSFSADGKKLGMDIDGPDGDKGAYTLASLRPRMQITRDDLISWNSFAGKPPNHRTIGFLSRISPDGSYAVTTLNEELYVSNFTNYRFIQVFYPTRGILAFYSTKSEEIKALPGADDPEYVHCNPTWSPDGRWIVFSRARARESYPKQGVLAAYPNDPAETPILYDLYRMPFNDGRGGTPQPLVGAAANGRSNSFPKVTPDGRFVVFVKAANGQLLRPDSELWIVPFEGGPARRMECNTSLMNSWHSFSPNGRWMVFSSKANTPYTQMFLTHLDEQGRSTPPILVRETTAANRAVNIPEFVNIPYDGLVSIEAPSVEHYRLFNAALAEIAEGQWPKAVATLERALTLEPDGVKSRLLLGTALWRTGRAEEAIASYQRAVELDPGRAEGHYSLSLALFLQDRQREAIERFKRAFAIQPKWGRLPEQYDSGLAMSLPVSEAVAVEASRSRLAQGANEMAALSPLLVLASLRAAAADGGLRNGQEAVLLAKRACALTRFQMAEPLDVLAGAYAEAGRFEEAVRVGEFALWFARASERAALVPGLERRLALYRQGKPFRRAS